MTQPTRTDSIRLHVGVLLLALAVATGLVLFLADSTFPSVVAGPLLVGSIVAILVVIVASFPSRRRTAFRVLTIAAFFALIAPGLALRTVGPGVAYDVRVATDPSATPAGLLETSTAPDGSMTFSGEGDARIPVPELVTDGLPVVTTATVSPATWPSDPRDVPFDPYATVLSLDADGVQNSVLTDITLDAGTSRSSAVRSDDIAFVEVGSNAVWSVTISPSSALPAPAPTQSGNGPAHYRFDGSGIVSFTSSGRVPCTVFLATGDVDDCTLAPVTVTGPAVITVMGTDPWTLDVASG